MKPLKEGQRVRVKSLDVKGVVFHVDQPNYFNHYMLPIQVTLDKPLKGELYPKKGSTMYRTDVTDIVRLKKKVTTEPVKTKKKKKKSDELIFDFS